MSDPAPNVTSPTPVVGESERRLTQAQEPTSARGQNEGVRHLHAARPAFLTDLRGVSHSHSKRVRKQSWWKKWRKAYEKFRDDEPGQRFIHAYQRWGGRLSPLQGILVNVAGVLCMVLGFALGLIPGVPGIVLGAGGLVLLAIRSRTLAMGLDSAEYTWRRWWRKLKHRRSGR